MANGFLFLPLAFSAVQCSSAADGYRSVNIGDDRMGLVWKSGTGSATQNLTIDLGADTALDTITLHGLYGAQSAWQWEVELATEAQGKFTGSYWSAGGPETLLAGATMPVTGQGRALWQAPSGAPASARYVRLAFSVLSNAAIQVGRVCIGQRIQPERNFSYGAAFGVRPLGSLEFSAQGTPLKRTGRNLRGVGVTLSAATREEIEADIMPFLELVGNTSAVSLVIDPTANTHRQNRMFFGYLTGDLGSIWAGYDRFTTSFNLVEEA